jgi:hypothetical protein
MRLAIRLVFFVCSFAFIALSSAAQPPRKSSYPPELHKFSSEQLKTCANEPKHCAHDLDEITDELARRLPQLSTEQLLDCFDDWKICGVWESRATGWPISDELARRCNPRQILARYWREPKSIIRNGIEHVAYHFDTPEVTAFMLRVLAEHKEDGEDLYWPANYLAKKCDPKALQMLSTGRYRNQGCMQYSTTVELFGKCRYRPAIPYLIETAAADFCLNIVDAADHSLRTLYPGSPKRFDSLEDMRHYFADEARKEGLKVQP